MEGLEEFEKIKITTSVLAAGVTEKIKEGKEETTAKLTEELIKAAKTWNLTEEQQKLLKEAEEDYNNGNYQQGLEKILTLTNSNTEENNTEE
jgi:RNA polymerase-interacting CarD/CdnL/TRCF family regulator